MRRGPKIVSIVLVVIAAPIILLLGSMSLERWKPSHAFDPVTRFIRSNATEGKYTSLSPGLFEIGESRARVEERLKDSSFSPAKGTPFADLGNTESEKWFRRDQFLALWHFNVRAAFDGQGRLVSADGLVAGPTFE